MIKNKFFSFFTLIVFCFAIEKNAIAEEQFDYQHLSAGSCITEDGFFFTESGMINLVVNVQEKVKLINIDNNKQIDLLKLDIKKCSESRETEIKIIKQSYEKQLLIKQSVIDSYKKDLFWQNIQYGLTGFVVGVFITAGTVFFMTLK